MPNSSPTDRGSDRSSSMRFGEDVVRCGGLRHLLNVLNKEALPLDVDYDIRQSAYLIALQAGLVVQM